MNLKSQRIGAGWPELRRLPGFSNPSNEHRPDVVTRLGALREERFTGADLARVFSPGAELGTFEESAHFLPWAFEFLRRAPAGECGLLSGIVCFVSSNWERLVSRRVGGRVKSGLLQLVDGWATQFVVGPSEEDVSSPTFTGLRWSETIREFFFELYFRRTLADLADGVLRQWATSEDAIKAAWLLEIARSQVWSLPYVFCNSPDIPAVQTEGEREFLRQYAEELETTCGPGDRAQFEEAGRNLDAVHSDVACGLLLRREQITLYLDRVARGSLVAKYPAYFSGVRAILEKRVR